MRALRAQATESYYAVATLDMLSRSTCPQYLQWAETQFVEEKERAQRFLESATEGKLIRVLDKELVIKHASTLMSMPNSDVASMMRDGRTQDLHRLFSLLARAPGCLEQLAKVVGACIGQEGELIVSRQVQDQGKWQQ